MFCGRAWQRVAPMTRRAFKPATSHAAPVRGLAYGLPGGSFNMAYFVLCGGGLAATLVYAYRTINSDTERCENRLASMSSPAKAAAPATEVVAESASAPEEAAEASGEPEAAPAGAFAEEPDPPAAAEATSQSTLVLGGAIATETPQAEAQTAEPVTTATVDESGAA